MSSASRTLAVAESLTGGLLAAKIVAVPGASAVFRGGVVAYATDLKAQLLGVDPELLATHGPVDPDVAQQMARGVAALLAADVGLATTGVAGPGAQAGRTPGTVFVALCGPGATRVERHSFAGDRSSVRAQAVAAALALLSETFG